MSARRGGVILFIVLAVALASAVLAVFLQGFVRQYVVLPVSFVAWLLGLVANSIPQSAYWAVLVAAAALIAWRAVLGPLRRNQRGESTPLATQQAERSHLAERQGMLARLDGSGFARERVASDLRALVVQQIAYLDHQPVDEVERRIRAGPLSLPGEVASLLADWQHWLAEEPIRPWARRLRALRQRLGLQPVPAPEDSRYLRQVARVIDYLENELAVPTGGPADGPTGG